MSFRRNTFLCSYYNSFLRSSRFGLERVRKHFKGVYLVYHVLKTFLVEFDWWTDWWSLYVFADFLNWGFRFQFFLFYFLKKNKRCTYDKSIISIYSISCLSIFRKSCGFWHGGCLFIITNHKVVIRMFLLQLNRRNLKESLNNFQCFWTEYDYVTLCKLKERYSNSEYSMVIFYNQYLQL